MALIILDITVTECPHGIRVFAWHVTSRDVMETMLAMAEVLVLDRCVLAVVRFLGNIFAVLKITQLQ